MCDCSRRLLQESRIEEPVETVQQQPSVSGKARDEGLVTTSTIVSQETGSEEPVRTASTRSKSAAEGTRWRTSDY